MRYCLHILLVVAALLGAFSMTPASAQVSYDRRGGDYASSPLRSGDPADCALACERDRRCRAWSFNYPRVSGDTAVCWLKNTVPPRVPDSCCVSGVRGAGVLELRNGAVEVATDRQGGDYRSLDVAADPRGATCMAVCEADNKCRAWTYVRPGYISKEPRCFLKNQIKPPRRKPGFISGVIR